MANTYQISNLLEKMTSADKDYRFMATNDLMAELQKDSIKLDDESERKVVSMLLLLLRDKNGEVQNLAVKCLGPLVKKVKEYQVEQIVDTLCKNMVSEKAEELRDISSIGLKTVIAELPPNCDSLVASICKKITTRLNAIVAESVSKQDEVSIQLEVLDLFSDLLSRFGSSLLMFHASILEALLPQLRSPRLAVRKRAITSIGYLTTSCSDNLFNKLMDTLIHELATATNSNASVIRTYIQCIGTISRHSGHRIGGHLEKLMPFLTSFCQRAHEHGDEYGDELREYCLQALESLVRRCPKEITGHIPSIISICLDFISYDPNYNYDDDEDEGDDGMETDGEEADESDGEAEEEYSDDDDISWKVRRASAKCLEAIIATRHEMLTDLSRTIAPQLVTRFKEREENVKVDIFNAYVALLRQARSTGPRGDETNAGPVQLLRQQVPALVKSLTRQLRKEKKSIKTRQGAFHLLTELSIVVPGALSDHISALIPAIQNSFSDKEKNTSSNMKIDTLCFLHCLISNHPATVFHPHVAVLVPAVAQAVYDPFYKISSEALNVLQLLLRVLRPFDGQPNAFNFAPYIPQIYQCTLVKLKATDIDQEVKERAISCMGQIISVLGDHLREELQACLPIFLDRLRNEITRLTTVKALTQIAASPLKIPLDMILCDGVAILANFLRKNQRALKLSTLTLLDTLFKHYPKSLDANMVNCIMKELRPLISESDLHISQLTLHLLTSVAQVHRQSLMMVTKEILPEILILMKSPLLQGAALNAMLEFFKALSYSNVDGVGFRQLLLLLTSLVYQQNQTSPPIHKNAYHSIAKCVAALTVANLAYPEAQRVVPEFLNEIVNSTSTDSVHQFALLAIGEIGKHVDLSGIPDLKAVLLSAFDSHSEEVKTAAAFALGSVAVGNLLEYLPFILAEVEDHPRKQYLLLHALKETISCQSGNAAAVDALKPHIETIWAMLMKHCECEEEGTRNVVAECLGKLTLVDHETLLPRLANSLKSPSAYARSTVVTAMKFTISDQPQPIDALLKSDIGQFFRAIEDSDLNVRRVALVAFNSAAHNKPALVRDLLGQVMPQLYTETKTRPELLREVEMGPFKHTVDDGLDLRKAAFECMYTLLDSYMDRIDIFEFLTHVEGGLKDHYDIKMLTYLMLIRLSLICPSALLQRMDTIIEALRAPCSAKLKSFLVKQELEKQEELKRSALRAFVALQQIPDADKNPHVVEFMNQIKSTPDLQAIFEGIQKDASQAIGFMHDSSVEENMVY